MANITAKYYVRIGSNSEKEFINKTISMYSGLIAKANLFESSPGLISSLFLAISNANLKKEFIIDPVTNVFSFDPYNNGSIRTWQKVLKTNAKKKLIDDLHLANENEIDNSWIREIENPTIAQKEKVEVRGIKRAYRRLGDLLFPEVLKNTIGLKAIQPIDLTSENIDELVKNTLEYQNNILKLSKYNVEKYSDFTGELPTPSFILSPYFCINNDAWFEVMKEIWDTFSNQITSDNGALVLHTELGYLSSNFDSILHTLTQSKIKNIFLWLNAFSEEDASLQSILTYTDLIKNLVDSEKKVFNLYSGGFSIFLIPFGLHAVVNGPGYGMDRDAEPVIGGLPTAQYYIPTLHTRRPVAEAFDLISKNQLGITKSLFHQQICNCPICQEGIKIDASDLIQFYNELGKPSTGIDGNVRRFPTPEALERCKFHFILSRLIEFRWAQRSDPEHAFNRLLDEQKLWSKNNQHLVDWENALRSFR